VYTHRSFVGHSYVNSYVVEAVFVCVHRGPHIAASNLAGYGVATVSRIDKIIGLFCRISSLL